MKANNKRVISLILAALLVLGLSPAAGFAAEDEQGIENIANTPLQEGGEQPLGTENSEPGDIEPGDIVPGDIVPGENQKKVEEPPAEEVGLPDLMGEALYDYLLTLEHDALIAALGMLTQVQIDSLKSIMPESLYMEWFQPATGFLAMSAKEIADYLRGIPANEERIAKLIELMGILDEEKSDAVIQEFSEEEYIALFSLTGTIAGEKPAVDFTSAAALLSAPAAPAKRSAMRSLSPMGDTVPLGGGTQPDLEGLELNKTISEPDNDGNYKIRLEAYTTGEVKITTETVPTDIVLVLDVSGSMADSFPSTTYTFALYKNQKNFKLWENKDNLWFSLGNNQYAQVTLTRVNNGIYYNPNYTYTYTYTDEHAQTQTSTSGHNGNAPYWPLFQRSSTTTNITRLAVLKTAVNSFIDSTLAQNNGVSEAKQHKIGIVQFSGSASTVSGLTAVNATGAASLKTSVDGLSANGATNSAAGMLEASKLIPSTIDGRKQVVIMFTDGVPTTSTAFSDTVANGAISNSKPLKSRGVSVYTVGIFPGAAVNENATLPTYYPPEPGYFGDQRSDAKILSNSNRYMHLVSSNYKTATSLTVTGNSNSFPGNTTGVYVNGKWTSFYLAASDANALEDIFEEISNQIGEPTTNIPTEAVLKDTVSDYFEISPSAGASSITIKTADAKYTDSTLSFINEQTITTGITANVSNKTVSVTGFDYYANFVSPTPRGTPPFYGKKLIVEITVKRAPGFIGGNNVPSNVPGTSGLYASGTASSPSETFGESPKANLPLLYNTAKVVDQHIYAGSDVTFKSLFEGHYNTATTPEGYPYELGEEVTNQFAKVVYTVKNGTTLVGTYTVPAGASASAGTWLPTSVGSVSDVLGDIEYTITATVSPSENATNGTTGVISIADINIGTANIYVYKPTITMQNLAVYLTQTPALEDAITGVVWKHGNTASTQAGIPTPAPALQYEFTPSWGAGTYPTEDKTDVAITSVNRTDKASLELLGVATISKTESAATDKHFTVYVYKPTVNCTDTTIFLGDTTNLADRYTGVTWEATSGAPSKPATAPTLTLTPVFVRGTDPAGNGGTANYAPQVESDFNVEVKVGSIPITDFTTFKTVEHPAGILGTPAEPGHHFTITVVAGTLTITKSVNDAKAGENFIFKITGPQSLGTLYAVISGAGEAKITGLPKGTYTVEESTSWSWRYKDTAYSWGTGDKEISAANHDIACTVTNSNRTPFWLSGESSVVNKFHPYVQTAQ